MDNIIIVSCDGHVSAPVETYAAYLETRYHDQLWFLAREAEEYLGYFGIRGRVGGRPAVADLDTFDTRHLLRRGAEFGTWDPTRRLEALDADGIAAEFLLWGTQYGTTPFFAVGNRPHPPELRAAGARAWNRMLADMHVASAGRLIGVAEPGPCLDMDATIAELTWAAEHGFAAVTVPGSPFDQALPPLHDAHFEPFWATCAELGLVLSVHAGWGAPQGSMQDTVDQSFSQLEGALTSDIQKLVLRLDMGPRSVFWKLMLAGVFDRYPELVLSLTEIRSDWVPATIAHLDARLEPGSAGLTMRPSEYFRRNCVMIPSAIHRAEVDQRHEVGVDNLLFGADYPHFEATWPNSWDWIRDAFRGVPEPEVRKVLGENAIRVFGLDERQLRAIARRIGPRRADILGEGHAVAPALLDHFHTRAGYLRPAEELDASAIDASLDADLLAIATTTR